MTQLTDTEFKLVQYFRGLSDGSLIIAPAEIDNTLQLQPGTTKAHLTKILQIASMRIELESPTQIQLVRTIGQIVPGSYEHRG